MTSSELKTIRRCLGLTQRALAAAMGVSLRAVESWEQGKRPVPAWVPKFFDLLKSSSP